MKKNKKTSSFHICLHVQFSRLCVRPTQTHIFPLERAEGGMVRSVELTGT